MQPPKSPQIAYHPPKSSSFGHSTSARDPSRVWLQTKAFLGDLTDYNLRPKLELRIQCYPKWSDPKVIEYCINEATDLFGPADKILDELNRTWHLPTTQLDAAVEFAIKDVARPHQEIGPTWLSFSYDLFWKSHPTISEHPKPGEGSSLGVIHGGRRLFLQPTLLFPFQEITPEFREFVSHVQADLPFRFRESCFKMLLPTKDGKSMVVRKIEPGWFDG